MRCCSVYTKIEKFPIQYCNVSNFYLFVEIFIMPRSKLQNLSKVCKILTAVKFFRSRIGKLCIHIRKRIWKDINRSKNNLRVQQKKNDDIFVSPLFAHYS